MPNPGVRFHGSDLSGLKGGQDLAGAVISSSQVLALALSVLAGLQISIDDERPHPLRERICEAPVNRLFDNEARRGRAALAS